MRTRFAAHRRHLAALGLGLSLPLASAPAQGISMLLGQYTNGLGDRTESFRQYTFRIDHVVARWLVAEVGTSYASVYIDRGYPATERYFAPRRAFDASLGVQLPLGAVRPYLAGGVARFQFDSFPAGPRQERRTIRGTSRLLSAGLRVDARRHVMLRAEYRARWDRPRFETNELAIEGETALGVGYRW